METDEAIKIILKYRKQIHTENLWADPMALSDAMTRLAVGNAYLADNIAPLHAQATGSELTAFKAARDMDTGVTEAERLAKGETLVQRQEYENVKHIYASTSNLISVLQSRLRVIENARKQEGIE